MNLRFWARAALADAVSHEDGAGGGVSAGELERLLDAAGLER